MVIVSTRVIQTNKEDLELHYFALLTKHIKKADASHAASDLYSEAARI
jgi:hypothetical protein